MKKTGRASSIIWWSFLVPSAHLRVGEINTGGSQVGWARQSFGANPNEYQISGRANNLVWLALAENQTDPKSHILSTDETNMID